MLAVAAAADVVEPLIAAHPQELAIAAYNSPRQTVISGSREAIDHVKAVLRTQQIESTPLTVSHAFHSPLMDPILEEFHAMFSSIELHPPKFPIASNLTGELAGPEIQTPEYWCRQLRSPVQFVSAMKLLQKKGANLFLEIGPQPVLTAFGRNTVKDRDRIWLSSLRQRQDNWKTLLQSLGIMFEAGVRVDWNGFDQGYSRRRVDLPTYPFHRSRCWLPDTMADADPSFLSVLGKTDKLRSLPDSPSDLQQQLERDGREWLSTVVWRETSRFGRPRSVDARHESVWVVIGSSSPLHKVSLRSCGRDTSGASSWACRKSCPRRTRQLPCDEMIRSSLIDCFRSCSTLLIGVCRE